MILLSIWWLVQATTRHLACEQHNTPYWSSATYTGWKGWPLEALAKLLIAACGMVGEGVSATAGYENGPIRLANLQHVTMYSMFFISGIVDLLCHFKAYCAPPGIDFVSLSLAFGTEAFLFSFHLMGRDSLDVAVHILLLRVIQICCVVIILEFAFPTSVWLAYTRAYMLALKGSWLSHAGLILQRATLWKNHISLVTICFTWHCAVIFMLFMLAISLLKMRHSSKCKFSMKLKQHGSTM